MPNEAEDTIRPLAKAQFQAHIISDGDEAFAKIVRSAAVHNRCSRRDWNIAHDGVHNNIESFTS